jgi:predicted amidophosphoribosyltransferase
MDTQRCPRCSASAPEIAPGQPLCDVCWEALPSRLRRAVARLKPSRQQRFALGQLEVPPARRKKRPSRRRDDAEDDQPSDA